MFEKKRGSLYPFTFVLCCTVRTLCTLCTAGVYCILFIYRYCSVQYVLYSSIPVPLLCTAAAGIQYCTVVLYVLCTVLYCTVQSRTHRLCTLCVPAVPVPVQLLYSTYILYCMYDSSSSSTYHSVVGGLNLIK